MEIKFDKDPLAVEQTNYFYKLLTKCNYIIAEW